MPVAESLQGRSGEGATRPSQMLARLQTVLAAALVVVFMVLGWMGRGPIEIGAGDDVIYLSLSRSLESGSYREIYRASAPLQTKYPPAFPAWLVLVRRATGDRLDAIVVANLILVALAMLLLYAVARQFAGGWCALALLLLLGLSQALLWMGGSYYPEALFLLLSTGSLVATLSAERHGQRAVFAAIALALLAFLTRLAGITLVVAIGVWLWSRRKRIELAVYALASTLVVGGWFGYVRLASSVHTVRSYASEYGLRGSHIGGGAISQLTSRVWHNALVYGTELLPAGLSLLAIHGTRIDDWFWLVVNLTLLSTGIVVLWRRWRAAAAYLVLYAGLLLIWPWPIDRLLDPAVPLVLLTFLLGAWRLALRLPVRARGPVLAGFVALLTVGATIGAAERVGRYRACDRANPFTNPGCFNEHKRSIVSASEYLREHAAAGDVVLAWRPSDVQFLSGHLGEHAELVLRAPAGDIAHELRERKIQHVLLTPIFAQERGALADGLLAACRELQVEARFQPQTLLLSTTVPVAPTADACPALSEFVRANPNIRAGR